MPHLTPKRDQHAAALSYLDTGTLALADVLARLDEEPPEAAGRPPIRSHRARWLSPRARIAVWVALSAAVPLAYVLPSPWH